MNESVWSKTVMVFFIGLCFSAAALGKSLDKDCPGEPLKITPSLDRLVASAPGIETHAKSLSKRNPLAVEAEARIAADYKGRGCHVRGENTPNQTYKDDVSYVVTAVCLKRSGDGYTQKTTHYYQVWFTSGVFAKATYDGVSFE